MEVRRLELAGVLVIEPLRRADARGFFAETWHRKAFAEIGIDTEFVQENHVFSTKAGTLRGMHFQAPPHAQAKLVRCARGRLFDVAVDIRVGSPTFGRWTSTELSSSTGREIFIPEGFLHGYVTLEPDTDVTYLCSRHYTPEAEGTVRFDDPDIAIHWGWPADKAILSARDSAAPRLREMTSPFTYGSRP